jgi:hypothetical protein|tara:strand:+ start:2006 stop:2209 length:204 start_codon:yes stop_codon:yes gene_type:complete
MKEETLIQIKNKVERLEQTMQQVIQELYNLKNLSVGTLETIKRMPDYQEALDDLKKDAEKEKKDEKE